MLELILIEAIYALTINAPCLVCYIVALVKAKHGKKPWGWFVGGTLLQSIYIVGKIYGIVSNHTGFSLDDIVSLAATAVFFVAFLLLLQEEEIKKNI